MKLLITLLLLTMTTVLTVPVYAVDSAADSPQSLYLKAGKEERAGSAATAKAIYESIIDRFPESEFAVKANDRLLAMPPIGQKPKSGPAKEIETVEKLLSPPEAAPLPTDPLLRRGIEAARLKSRGEIVAREEFDRLKRADEVREGHKGIQTRRAEKEPEWRQEANRKVTEEFGMTLEEMTVKLDLICKEAGVKGECSEESLLRLAPAAKAE